jgi:hypothetical protein
MSNQNNFRNRISRFSLIFSLLFGLLNASSLPPAVAATIGSGKCVQTVDSITGVSVVESGAFCYVAFKSGTRVWTSPVGVVSIDLLVVGGGGGGASRHAGGGGAGGLLQSTGVGINGSDLTITVGTGGAGGAAQSTAGSNASNGTNSSVSGGGITTLNAVGGGGGSSNATAGSGGSGGGGNCCASTAGTGTLGQGNSGSNGVTDNSTYWVGGGGGGAGGAGTNSVPTKAGSGGTGVAISWISTSIGTTLAVGAVVSSQLFFAGGGGGGSDRNSIPGGDGGNGGGAPGSTGLATATNGTVNTGGGGGASGISGVGTGSLKGGDGGSGVVVIRYLMPVFNNSATSSIAENTPTSTNAATVVISESSTITIRPVLDSSFFTVVFVDSVTARIRFNSSPDFEARADSGGNNEYDLTIRATMLSGNYSESSLKITLTDVIETAVLGAPSLSGAPSKGRSVTITVTSDTPGKIRFFFAGKKIPNCLARATSGSYPNFSATCPWVPITSGLLSIYATLTPTDVTLSAITSGSTVKFVSRRAGLR